MRDSNQSNFVKSTVVAGVVGSAATALFFLMRNKSTRKRILSGIDNAWERLSKNEVIDEITQKNPVRKMLDTFAGTTDEDRSSANLKKKSVRNDK